MADKKIVDFITLADAKDDDLILVASEGETYTMKVRTLKEAVLGSAQRAEAAAMEMRELAVQMKTDADSATVAANLAAENANTARESANTAASAANTAAQNATEQANEGERKITVAVKMAEDAANTASIAAQEASESKTAADTAAENANTKAQEADTATQNANSAAQAATTAKENAQAQGAYAQEQGDRAEALIDEIKGTEVGDLGAKILDVRERAEDNTNSFTQILYLLVQTGVLTAAQCNTLHNMNGLLRVYAFAGQVGFTQTAGKFDSKENVVYI